MKKLFAVWVLVVLVLPFSADAETVNMGSDGTVWLEKMPSSTKIEVTFGEGVLEHGDIWKQAFLKPGTVVPVKTSFVQKTDGLFHIEKTSVIDVGIVYDDHGVRLVGDVVGESQTDFTPYAIFWLVSVLSMTLNVVMVRRGKDNDALASFAAAFAAALASFAAKKQFYVFSGMYYVAMVASMVAFLLS